MAPWIKTLRSAWRQRGTEIDPKMCALAAKLASVRATVKANDAGLRPISPWITPAELGCARREARGGQRDGGRTDASALMRRVGLRPALLEAVGSGPMPF